MNKLQVIIIILMKMALQGMHVMQSNSFFFPGVMRRYVSVTVYIFLLVYIVYISCIPNKLKLLDQIMYGP